MDGWANAEWIGGKLLGSEEDGDEIAWMAFCDAPNVPQMKMEMEVAQPPELCNYLILVAKNNRK